MNYLDYVLNLLEQIPASFWGVVAGAMFSLGGVTLTNQASDRRMRSQFEHERLQRSKDLAMTLRKEIFLMAAEAIAVGVNSVGKFANLDLTEDKITAAYMDKSPAIAKVHVIGGPETMRSVMQFTSEIGSCYLRLMGPRIELLRIKSELSIVDGQLTSFEKERDRFLELMKQYNIEVATEARRWKVLEDNFEFEQQRITEAIDKRSRLLHELQPKHLAFLRLCVEETLQLASLLAPMISAIRAELDLDFDEESYCRLVEENVKKQRLSIEQFVQGMAVGN